VNLLILYGIDFAMRKKKVIMFRIISLDKVDRSFDFAFWRKVGPQGILEAMVQMIYDYYKLRGYGHPPRLRRSVAVLKRR
jgi:hypothetical protein